jgi:hypothetical protein
MLADPTTGCQMLGMFNVTEDMIYTLSNELMHTTDRRTTDLVQVSSLYCSTPPTRKEQYTNRHAIDLGPVWIPSSKL